MTNTPALAAAALCLAATTAQAELTLTSPEFADGERLQPVHTFDGFGCAGANRSPALEWSGAPAGTQSFALLVHDPDAPIASGWWHWVIVDIPAGVSGLPADAGDVAGDLAPAGSRQVRTSFGTPGWGGPCPPEGHAPHRYHFTLYALGTPSLGLADDTTAEIAAFTAGANALATAELTGRYGR